MSSDAVEAYLRQHIPISHAMGIRVVQADLQRVALSAPLEPNLNHRSAVDGAIVASFVGAYVAIAGQPEDRGAVPAAGD
jgi:hypothetical protein